MSANDRQEGGSHYKDAAAAGGEQHWDMMWRLYREGWFVGNITKYVLRYRRKHGLADLKKARHYLDKLIELEGAEEGLLDDPGEAVLPLKPPAPAPAPTPAAAGRGCVKCGGWDFELIQTPVGSGQKCTRCGHTEAH